MGQRKMSQVLGVVGLLGFIMLWPLLSWACSETYELFISSIFHIFSGRGKTWILNPWVGGFACASIFAHSLFL